MAADSAVTVGNRYAVYNSADKLFQLSPNAPVGLLAFGKAELMGVPLEIIVSEYGKHTGNKTFPYLKQYVEDFCSFIEHNSEYFMFEQYESKYLYDFCGAFLREIKMRFDSYTEYRENSKQQKCDSLKEDLNNIFTDFLEELDKFVKTDTSFAKYVESKHYDFLKSKIIEDNEIDFLTADQKKMLCEKAIKLLDTDFSPDDTGVAIAGYGDKEIYPSLHCFYINGVFKGKVRLAKYNSREISEKCYASIHPFAQRDIMDNILTGIDNVERELINNIPYNVARGIGSMDDSLFAPGKKENVISEIFNGVGQIVSYVIDKTEERNNIIDSVKCLPIPELTSLAESMINITSILRKVKIDEKNSTVGGPVDSLVISKSGGLKWMKKKNYCNE